MERKERKECIWQLNPLDPTDKCQEPGTEERNNLPYCWGHAHDYDDAHAKSFEMDPRIIQGLDLPLNRRYFLRGIGVTAALPLLIKIGEPVLDAQEDDIGQIKDRLFRQHGPRYSQGISAKELLPLVQEDRISTRYIQGTRDTLTPTWMDVTRTIGWQDTLTSVLHLKQGNITQALNDAKSAQDYGRQTNTHPLTAYGYIREAAVHVLYGSPEQAKKIATSGLQPALRADRPDMLCRLYMILMEAYAQLGNVDRMREYEKLSGQTINQVPGQPPSAFNLAQELWFNSRALSHTYLGMNDADALYRESAQAHANHSFAQRHLATLSHLNHAAVCAIDEPKYAINTTVDSIKRMGPSPDAVYRHKAHAVLATIERHHGQMNSDRVRELAEIAVMPPQVPRAA